MPDYKKMYFRLFNKVSDAIELLQQAQLEGEEAFISGDDTLPIELLDLRKQNETIVKCA